MAEVDVVIFHQAAAGADPPLVRQLADARWRLAHHQAALFGRAGARRVEVLPGRDDRPTSRSAETFGEHLASIVASRSAEGLVVMGSGAVPRLSAADARDLVEAAGSRDRVALTNNRYSSDVVAVADAGVLRQSPPLPSDNALPRWLEERAGYAVRDLPGRDRLALDLDTPLDIALLGLVPRLPSAVQRIVRDAAIDVPRLAELRELARDPHRELLVFGRSGSSTLQWLERHVRCRVRFLAEERGMRASSPLAIGTGGSAAATVRDRPPRATLGRLLADRGPAALAEVVSELGDGAIIDTRVLFADRLGLEERHWPSAADRFASDLLGSDAIADPWLRELTGSAAGATVPILLGAHTLVGPGIPLLLRHAS